MRLAACAILVICHLWLAVHQVYAKGETCQNEDPEDLQALLQSGQPHVARQSALESIQSYRSLLESAAAGAFDNIAKGRVSKSEVEIVLAHFNEDIRWSKPYRNIRTIYCKGPENKRPDGCTALPNVGREGHTYLHHIVQNYENLSDWTVFTQAQAPTQGYRGHRAGGGHTLPGVPFDAYVLPEEAGGLPRDDGSAFVFTGAMHMRTLNHSLRLSFADAAKKVVPELHQQGRCPRAELLDGWQRWWDLGWFKEAIGKRCGCSAEQLPSAFLAYWDTYIGDDRPEDEILFFAQGARFAASRERIQQRPLRFYEDLLKLISTKNDPCHNYFNEWMWYYIIGKPKKTPCDKALFLLDANKQSSRVLKVSPPSLRHKRSSNE